jgi:two-component system, OmpR family, response regulator CpxR
MHPTLLIADGDKQLCELLEMYLGENGYQVETTSDATDCMTMLRQLMPAVLVLDLEICWGVGNGLLACLSQECSHSGGRIVLTGPIGYLQITRMALEPSVVNYLSKPFTADALLESIQSAVASVELCPLHS